MVSAQNEYGKKLISAEDAAGLVKTGMWIDFGYFCGFPILIDEKLAQRAHELEKVKIRVLSSLTEPQVIKIDPNQQHFIYSSWQLSAVERKYHDVGCCSYIPSNLGEIPRIYREWLKDQVDIAFIEVTPMNEHGYFNFGAAISYEKAICDAARTVVVEVNESQPWSYGGYDEAIHISEVDFVVENTKYEISELPLVTATKTDEEIAENVAELIEDGATIQLGIGGTPNAVGKILLEHGFKDLGIHTGILVDSMVDLIEAGVVTGKRKNIDPGKVVHAGAIGSRRLYEYLHHNTMLAGFPVSYTNDIFVMSRIRNLVTINSALKVDLKGQVCSESAGLRQISGTGGQLDWIRGASMSPGGKATICLHSTRKDRQGDLTSNILLNLELGDTVTIPASDVCHVITEFGTVDLKGKSSWQRAKQLISIAHPNFRSDLEEAAEKVNLYNKAGNKGGEHVY